MPGQWPSEQAPASGGATWWSLSDGSTAEGGAADDRHDIPLDRLNLAAIASSPRTGTSSPTSGCGSPNVCVAGDVAGPSLHTHTAHYQGELAARIALGGR